MGMSSIEVVVGLDMEDICFGQVIFVVGKILRRVLFSVFLLRSILSIFGKWRFQFATVAWDPICLYALLMLDIR